MPALGVIIGELVADFQAALLKRRKLPPASKAVLSQLQNDSAWALSKELPRRLMLCTAL